MADSGKQVLRLALVVVLIVHLLTLYLPGGPDAGPELFPHADKVIHFVAFGVPTMLARLLSVRWWPVVLLALHAPVSELVQHFFLQWRGGDPWDAVADLVGVGAGVLAASWLRRRSTAGRMEPGLVETAVG